MTFDPLLADRVRKVIESENVIEETYPDGVGFSINKNLACGINNEYLIVRVGEDRYEEILTHPLSRPMDINGKPTPGWVGIIPTGTKRDVDLAGWVKTGLEYARSLPEK
jgi:hypothetical protein